MSTAHTVESSREGTSTGNDQNRSKVSKWSLFIAAFSTVVEWYDFTLYLYMTTVLSRVFYGGGEGSIAFALLTFAVAYLMRPFGAIVFGHIGDRFGRKRMMLITMAVMTIAMLVTALLPTSAQIGAAAGWLMLLLRMVMAFAVGGEYTGVITYLIEGAGPNRRGFLASLAAASSEVGALLAAGVAAATVAFVPADQLDVWGWRIPFFVGAAMAAVVWVSRSLMNESPEFERQKRENDIPEAPLKKVLVEHFPAVLRTFCISALGSITYYVGISYVPTYLHDAIGMSEADALWISTVAAVAVIAVSPIVGIISDRVGRRPVLITVSALGIVVPPLMFWAMGGTSLAVAVAGVVALACLGGAVSAIAPSACAEQFPGEGRVSGLAFGLTMATAVFGGLTPWLSQVIMDATGNIMVPAYIMAVVAIGVLPVMLASPETAPRIVGGRDADATGRNTGAAVTE